MAEGPLLARVGAAPPGDALEVHEGDDEVLHEIVAGLCAVLDGAAVGVLGLDVDGVLRPRVGNVHDDRLAREAIRQGSARDAHGTAVAATIGSRVVGVVHVRDPKADTGLLQLAGRLVARGLERRSMIARLVEAREQAEAASRFKQTILYAVTHDVKIPLNALAMQCQMMENGTVPWQQVVHGMTRHLERICLMLDDFLDMAAVDAGRLVLHKGRVDVAALMRDVCGLFAPLAGQHDIHIRLDAPSLDVWADEARLRQALSNLVSNAIKYSRRGGTIWIAARRDDGVAIEVKDNGPGIDPDRVEHLFQPFGQVLDSFTQRGGSGLGLYLARIIVEEHGGHLQVQSTPGQGTTFTLHLTGPPGR